MHRCKYKIINIKHPEWDSKQLSSQQEPELSSGKRSTDSPTSTSLVAFSLWEAASLFENNWLSWQIVTVSDDKIQILLLILRRGALSTSTSLVPFSSLGSRLILTLFWSGAQSSWTGFLQQMFSTLPSQGIFMQMKSESFTYIKYCIWYGINVMKQYAGGGLGVPLVRFNSLGLN